MKTTMVATDLSHRSAIALRRAAAPAKATRTACHGNSDRLIVPRTG